nr:Kdo domain containing protein [uncultured Flavobacterium sp.]
MFFKINPETPFSEDEIFNLVINFHSSGNLLVKGNRNELKTFKTTPFSLNIKSFKIPVFINKIVYSYFKKSKAQRSYDYALRLIDKGIGTPIPVAFFENKSILGLKDSYYVCEHIQYDFMFRDLIETDNFPDLENILKQFALFSFDLHQKGIEFLDHSPGNTLIKKVGSSYEFYLVDLNRMKFHKKLSYEKRVNNLKRLTPFKEMIVVISEEYAKVYQVDEIAFFQKLWKATSDFQYKFYRKRRLKTALKIGKSNT